MADSTEKEPDLEQVQAQAQKAAEEHVDIADQVRDITLDALTKAKLEPERIKKVVKAVFEGVSIGTAHKQEQTRETLKQAMTGVDQALTKTAEASKLAIEEASGKVKDFSQAELNQAINDLRELEKTFLDTVGGVAKSAGQVVRETLDDLVAHAKHAGTSVGEHSKEVVDTLTQELGQTAREAISAGTEAAKTVSTRIAEAASGFLYGLAETIRPKEKGTQAEEPKEKK